MSFSFNLFVTEDGLNDTIQNLFIGTYLRERMGRNFPQY